MLTWRPWEITNDFPASRLPMTILQCMTGLHPLLCMKMKNKNILENRTYCGSTEVRLKNQKLQNRAIYRARFIFRLLLQHPLLLLWSHLSIPSPRLTSLSTPRNFLSQQFKQPYNRSRWNANPSTSSCLRGTMCHNSGNLIFKHKK